VVNPNKNYGFVYNDNRAYGVKGAWVKYSGSLKEAIAYSKTHDNGPFANVIGPKGGTDSYEYLDDDEKLKLENFNFTSRKSGAIHIRMNAGWYAQVRITTENTDFFDDNRGEGEIIDENVANDWFTENSPEALYDAAWPTMWISQSEWFADDVAEFVLSPNDYISFDIDGEFHNIAQARIRMDGIDFVQNKKINNEVYIEFEWIAEWDAEYPAREEPAQGDIGTEDDLDDLTVDNTDLETESQGGGAGDDNGGDDEPDYGDYSLLLVVGGIALILYAAFYVARPSGKGDE